MTNLKSLELDGDPYQLDAKDGKDGILTKPYPLDKMDAIKGLEKLKLKHSNVSKSIEPCGLMMLGLLPLMPKLTTFEIEFMK